MVSYIYILYIIRVCIINGKARCVFAVAIFSRYQSIRIERRVTYLYLDELILMRANILYANNLWIKEISNYILELINQRFVQT